MAGTVITFGSFDVFHIGHVNILERAAALGERLVVGVSSDALHMAKKQRRPVFGQQARLRIIGAMSCVSQVFVEESLDLKAEYIRRYEADILVMGDDWRGRFDMFSNLCQVVYLPRTQDISTTEILEAVRST